MNLNFLTKINFRGIFGLQLHLRAVQVKQGRVWQAGLIQTTPKPFENIRLFALYELRYMQGA